MRARIEISLRNCASVRCPCRWGDRGGDRVLEWLLANNFTSSHRENVFAATAGRSRRSTRPANYARTRDARAAARRPAGRVTPEIRASRRPRLIVTFAGGAARAPARVHGPIGRLDADGKLAGESASSGFPPDRLHALDPLDLYLRRGRRRVKRAGLIPTAIPARRCKMLKPYSRDEPFQIDEDTLPLLRADDPAARRWPRALARHELRPVRLGSRAARPLRQRCAPAHR
jgi:hypothetical protein